MTDQQKQKVYVGIALVLGLLIGRGTAPKSQCPVPPVNPRPVNPLDPFLPDWPSPSPMPLDPDPWKPGPPGP